jgi:transcriptional regulator with XRE-family HTH domain
LGRAMNLQAHIGMRVRSARRRAGLTQEQLAEAVRKATETISNVERGYSLTGLNTLERVAKAVGSPVSFFFEGYRPDRRITARRARLEQDVLDELAKLSDQEVGLAARLVKAIRAGD